MLISLLFSHYLASYREFITEILLHLSQVKFMSWPQLLGLFTRVKPFGETSTVVDLLPLRYAHPSSCQQDALPDFPHDGHSSGIVNLSFDIVYFRLSEAEARYYISVR